jgi:acylphosphatase
MAEQRIIHFEGNVQGVGFRFTTYRIAEGFDVTGFVKNLPDGRVKVVAEGEKKQIDQFISSIQDEMGGHIRDTRQQTASASGRYTSFGVKH